MNTKTTFLSMAFALSLVCGKAQTQTEGVFIKKQPLGNQFNSRHSAGMVATDTDLYIYGGKSYGNHQDFAKYNLATGILTKLSQMPVSNYNNGTEIKSGASFKVGDFMYYFDAYQAGVSRYNLATDVWEVHIVASPFSYNGSTPPGSGFVIGTTIYLTDPQLSSDAFYAFDTETLTFIPKAESPVSGKRGTFTFAINGKGYVGGGRSTATDGCYNDNGCYHHTFYEYDPATDTWTQKADYPMGIVGASGVAVNGKGYVGLGTGFDTQQGIEANFKVWYEYNPVTNEWTEKQVFLPGYNSHWTVSKASAVAVGTDIYIFGGNAYEYGSNNTKDNLYSYNTLTDEWTIIDTALGHNRTEAMGVFINGKLYAGGGNDFEFTNDFHEYDPITDSWSQKSDFPITRCSEIGTAVIGNKAYFAGGSYSANCSDKFYEYDSATDTWTELADYPGGEKAGMITVSYNNEIYAGLGYNSTISTPFYKFYKYTPATDTWTELATPEFVLGDIIGFYSNYFVIGDYLYVLSQPFSLNAYNFYRYSFSENIWTPITNISITGIHFTGQNNAFAFNGKGYFVANQNNNNYSSQKLMEFDPADNSFSYAGNIPFRSVNQTKIVADDGVYFAFGATLQSEAAQAGHQYSNQLWKWLPNPAAISTQTGIYTLQSNFEDCVFSFSTNQHQFIYDNEGDIFFKAKGTSYGQSNICIEVNSINGEYRETTEDFGEGETVALFANKSFMIKSGQFQGGNSYSLYFTNDELTDFINTFNTTYNENATIDDIKILRHCSYNEADHDPLNNGDYHFIHTPVTGDYANGKYFEVTVLNESSSLPSMTKEVYVVLFTQEPLSTPQTEKSNIVLYPNPVSNILHFSEAAKNVKVTDITGKVLIKQSNNSQIDMSTFQNGVYLITIETKNNTKETKKIIKS